MIKCSRKLNSNCYLAFLSLEIFKDPLVNFFQRKRIFIKSQGIYLESGLVSAFNGWTSQTMHKILLCVNFEAVVDVIWKSFLACLITCMLNFFQIKYFDVDTHGAFDSGSVSFVSACQGKAIIWVIISYFRMKSLRVIKANNPCETVFFQPVWREGFLDLK